MDELYAVFLESLDMNLTVFEKKEEAQALYDQLKEQGKPVRMETFGMWQVEEVERSNGNMPDDDDYWEKMTLNNGKCRLVVSYTWHKAPDPEGYYADYLLKF
ncbi:MAG: hypothetical protein PUA82_06860 [Eubacteriales bacterium]|nr:hypothetical protein [Eubacteriales bacterium]